MNSRQRRKHNRRFRHTVQVDARRVIETPDGLGDMLQWCHERYGENGYRFQWLDSITFGFPTDERAVEFKIAWA